MRWSVINSIKELSDNRTRERSLEQVTRIVLHRVGKDHRRKLSLGDEGPDIAKRFIHDGDLARYTGGENPYTFPYRIFPSLFSFELKISFVLLSRCFPVHIIKDPFSPFFFLS